MDQADGSASRWSYLADFDVVPAREYDTIFSETGSHMSSYSYLYVVLKHFLMCAFVKYNFYQEKVIL